MEILIEFCYFCVYCNNPPFIMVGIDKSIFGLDIMVEISFLKKSNLR